MLDFDNTISKAAFTDSKSLRPHNSCELKIFISTTCEKLGLHEKMCPTLNVNDFKVV